MPSPRSCAVHGRQHADGVTLDIHVALSPTPGFLHRLHLLAESCKRQWAHALDYRMIATVGHTEDAEAILARETWVVRDAVSWRQVDDAAFGRHFWSGTVLDRFRAVTSTAPQLMMDADMLASGAIDEALTSLKAADIAGVMAYASPFRGLGDLESDAERWSRLFAHAGLGRPPRDCQYSFAPVAGGCPPYFNFGFVLLSSDAARRLGEILLDELECVNEVFPHLHVRTQLALSLAICRLGLSYTCLPLRFNHPINLAAGSSAEWRNVRVIHYTKNPLFDADMDGGSAARLGAWLARPATANSVEEKLRDVLLPAHLDVQRCS
jgi:hypothetical protein